MSGDAVEEHAVVADHDRAAGEVEQRRLQAGEGLHVQVVGGLVQKEQVAALLQGERQVQPVALAAGEHACGLLLVGSLETEGGHVGAGGHFRLADHHVVGATGHHFPQLLVRIDPGAVLVDVGDLHRLADFQLAAVERL